MSDDEVVFISKSIGTVVATAYAHERSINARQIYFSPLEMIGRYAHEGAVLFYGDNDPLADCRTIEKIAQEKKLELHRVKGGNHSLETGDVHKDIENLRRIMLRVDEIVK